MFFLDSKGSARMLACWYNMPVMAHLDALTFIPDHELKASIFLACIFKSSSVEVMAARSSAYASALVV